MKRNKHNRSRIEVGYQILKMCKSPMGVTRIMTRSNLNYGQTKEMLDYLLLRGFLRESNGQYLVSDFGNELAMGLRTLAQIWNIPQNILYDPHHLMFPMSLVCD